MLLKKSLILIALWLINNIIEVLLSAIEFISPSFFENKSSKIDRFTDLLTNLD